MKNKRLFTPSKNKMEEFHPLGKIIRFAPEKEEAAQPFSLALAGGASYASTRGGTGIPNPRSLHLFASKRPFAGSLVFLVDI